MEDGFYLSTYLHIDNISHIMRFHIRHDQNISLWEKKGENIMLIHVWELERVTGLKKCNLSFYDVEQAKDMINLLLSEYDISLKDIKQVIGTPQLDTCNDYHSLKEYPEISYHSLSHLFSSLLMDTEIFYNENIIALAVDGGPDTVIDTKVYDKYFYCGAVSRRGEISVNEACSPGFLWTYTRKKSHLQEGSLMALATASTSTLYEEFDDILKIYKGQDLKKAYQYVDKLFLKVMNFTKYEEGKLFSSFDPRFTEEENKISMIAKQVQKMSLCIMDYNIEKMIMESGLDPQDTYFAISGGYGLNCPTNSYIMKKYGFKGFLALPSINDAGISIGMGLYYFFKNIPGMKFKFDTSYYGNKYVNFDEVVSSSEFIHHIESISDFDENEAVKDIVDGPIVWFDERAEIGPRALGHRSILGDPRRIETQDILNEIKQRQWWRPVAPIVLYDKLNDWFEEGYYSPYMLHTLKIKKECEGIVPAIRHLDNTARVQTIDSNDNPTLYQFIRKFYEKEKVPIICNTSLNDRGEPIIDSIEECLNFVLRKRIKVAYINKKRVVLQKHESYKLDKPLVRNLNLDFMSESEKQKVLKEVNPHALERETLIYMYIRPLLREQIDLKNSDDVSKLKKFAKLAAGKLGDIPTPGI